MASYATLPEGLPPAPQATVEAVHARLAAVSQVQFKQGRAILEGVTGGAFPNRFVLGDRKFMYQPTRNGKEYGEMEAWPMFIIEEKSGACGCCTCSRDVMCRICCTPGHPSLTELFVASGPQEGQDCCCGMCHTADFVTPESEAIMTYERLGCCTRFANCFVCCEMCQDEMRFHTGIPGADPDNLPLENTQSCIAIGKVPIGGGGCTPTVNLVETSGGDVNVEGKEIKMVVEGPTCFGGLYDWCCDTTFKVSRQAGGAGDMATITKLKPQDCNQCCRAMCSTADIYNLDINEGGNVTPTEKAFIIGEMVHLDFMFFERDNFPITCEQQGDTTWIHILCCLCYCYGCLCPIRCSIPLNNKQGGS